MGAAAPGRAEPQAAYLGAQEYYQTPYGVPISNQKVGVYLEIQNAKANRLGGPLPKGKVRVYKADSSGGQQLVGEDWIDHTPRIWALFSGLRTLTPPVAFARVNRCPRPSG